MFKFITAALFAIFSFTATAAKQPFTEQLYKQYQENNESYLIDVYATWCPTCKKQQKLISQYFEENPDSKIKVLIVDFDKQKEWVTHFRAPRQSTLALYKGQEQLWFAVAETDKRKVFSALSKAE